MENPPLCEERRILNVLKLSPPFGKDGGSVQALLGLEGVDGVDLDARVAAVVRTEAVLGGHAEGEVSVFGGDAERRVVRLLSTSSVSPFNG